jgi:NAD-dependent SIR2 family protein deacetylase
MGWKSMTQSDILQQSAELLSQASRVLYLTSAGMSADSNIPTFRDKDGYWRNFPPFKEKNLEAQDLASPWAFRNVLSHAWAFYEWRRRNADENSPHEGYHLINRWISEHHPESFIHTTNTDGYHLISGCPTDRVMEVHGSMWRLQCLDVCNYQFWEETSVPLCELDHDTMQASDLPRCKNCNSIARPHILMFGDGEYTGHPEQEKNFRSFTAGSIDLAILIGSSGAVPTNDYIAAEVMSRGGKVININPDPSTNSIVDTDYFIQMKSLEALVALDQRAFNR